MFHRKFRFCDLCKFFFFSIVQAGDGIADIRIECKKGQFSVEIPREFLVEFLVAV